MIFLIGLDLAPLIQCLLSSLQRCENGGVRQCDLTDSDGHQNLSERIDRVMQITLNRELDHLERYMTFLASVGRQRHSLACSAPYGE